MSSRDRMPPVADEELPPALSSMWRLCKLGYQHEPALMLVAFVLSLLAALPDALLALWFKLLGEGVLKHDSGLVRTAAIGLGLSAVATWFLRTVSTRVQRRFRDKVTIALESHVARLPRPTGERRGSAGTGQSRQPGGARPAGTRWPGPCSAARTSAGWSTCRPASTRHRPMFFSCSPRDRGCRRTSARPSARSGSCA